MIDSEDGLAAGVAALRQLDPLIDGLIRDGAEPPLRKRAPGLAGLVSIVMGQQLSTASAAAILGRLQAALPEMSAESLADVGDVVLLRAGLSRAKLRTLRAVACAILDGRLRIDALDAMPAEVAHAALTGVSGIGPWTADIYLLFCLGHPDVFPSGDLALQEAVRHALGLELRPDARKLAAIAERWRPWRGVAALVFWAHYRRIKSRDGAPVPPR